MEEFEVTLEDGSLMKGYFWKAENAKKELYKTSDFFDEDF